MELTKTEKRKELKIEELDEEMDDLASSYDSVNNYIRLKNLVEEIESMSDAEFEEWEEENE